MHETGSELLTRLHQALPEARVYWEKEPGHQLKGSVLTAELKQRKFTIRFESNNSEDDTENLDSFLVDQVVDDFVNFFARSIYPKEKFTRII